MTVHEFRSASVITVLDFLLVIELDERGIRKCCATVKNAFGTNDGLAFIGFLAQPRITQRRNIRHFAILPVGSDLVSFRKTISGKRIENKDRCQTKQQCAKASRQQELPGRNAD
ncbi:hypothetical protein D3C87_1742730 [compost metagenome]